MVQSIQCMCGDGSRGTRAAATRARRAPPSQIDHDAHVRGPHRGLVHQAGFALITVESSRLMKPRVSTSRVSSDQRTADQRASDFSTLLRTCARTVDAIAHRAVLNGGLTRPERDGHSNQSRACKDAHRCSPVSTAGMPSGFSYELCQRPTVARLGAMRTNASTTSGSKWVPRPPTMSWTASSWETGCR